MNSGPVRFATPSLQETCTLYSLPVFPAHRKPLSFYIAAPPLWWYGHAMEKRRPTYDLDAVKLSIGSVETLAITTSALRDATALGFDRGGIAQTINSLERGMFYKSMTTFADHRLWQDVYHVPSQGLTLYIKFQADVVTEFSVVSFKEK